MREERVKKLVDRLLVGCHVEEGKFPISGRAYLEEV
jgi:hypothetical protein